MNPTDIKYSKTHEWAKAEGNIITSGITDHAQTSLGDVVFVELPEIRATVSAGEAYGTIESVKAVSDVVAAVSGKVIEINEAVIDAPDTLNNDPYGEGWLIKIEAEDLSELESMMSVSEYETFVAEEEH
ncbi:glycine cleavage system protein GcvH [Desulfosporosinus sp. BICA1-9]|uniref:glycine cleavage system protein GcvH n=1 Tax=Desulfosporosinus sp. BICA1-9 TaxID=1531958 RepID=UPI00054B9400|nr:glycine cleavage system protein GcvH [Desulfosporosinus sp. BICA1-9]KJS48576.1 MAG: glycine cleavage system protein H [Peptococcaceae bacterium BRH_c23]KJS89755.1 MAG: glycine cleavage system protein H [Desulfosporosinus sp. BICA1-9]HBW38126.1 glycine cleavage system protein GcvH [Desulfosporosinus sp.]